MINFIFVLSRCKRHLHVIWKSTEEQYMRTLHHQCRLSIIQMNHYEYNRTVYCSMWQRLVLWNKRMYLIRIDVGVVSLHFRQHLLGWSFLRIFLSSRLTNWIIHLQQDLERKCLYDREMSLYRGDSHLGGNVTLTVPILQAF